jgi:hypothetical protein
MSAEIVSLADRPRVEREYPHLTGAAVCTICGHAWVAVAPVGTVHLTCPACERLHGAFKNAVEPETAWSCNCSGNQLFFLTRAGAMCRMCGVISSDWADA